MPYQANQGGMFKIPHDVQKSGKVTALFSFVSSWNFQLILLFAQSQGEHFRAPNKAGADAPRREPLLLEPLRLPLASVDFGILATFEIWIFNGRFPVEVHLLMMFDEHCSYRWVPFLNQESWYKLIAIYLVNIIYRISSIRMQIADIKGDSISPTAPERSCVLNNKLALGSYIAQRRFKRLFEVILRNHAGGFAPDFLCRSLLKVETYQIWVGAFSAFNNHRNSNGSVWLPFEEFSSKKFVSHCSLPFNEYFEQIRKMFKNCVANQDEKVAIPLFCGFRSLRWLRLIFSFCLFWALDIVCLRLECKLWIPKLLNPKELSICLHVCWCICSLDLLSIEITGYT